MVRKYLPAFLVGVLGVVVALGAWHLYEDHKMFHALVKFTITKAQEQAK